MRKGKNNTFIVILIDIFRLFSSPYQDLQKYILKVNKYYNRSRHTVYYVLRIKLLRMTYINVHRKKINKDILLTYENMFKTYKIQKIFKIEEVPWI